jgi:type IV secretion system protein VirB1
MLEFLELAKQCAPTVAPQTMAAIVHVESGYNPYAIGVVKGRLARQPKNIHEAVATAKSLQAAGYNFSLGIAQVNRYNLPKYGINYEQAFNPCSNLTAGSKILESCYTKAINDGWGEGQPALKAAFSCYYSGNFKRGFKPDVRGTSYVQRVVAGADEPVKVIPIVPAIKNGSHVLKPSSSDEQSSPSTEQILKEEVRDTAKEKTKEVDNDAPLQEQESPEVVF